MPEVNKVYTIFDRPFGLRFIGLLEMSFGAVGLLSTVGILAATLSGNPEMLDGMGYIYSLLIFVGVVLPNLIIGNYVDDLRKNAVIAQIIYSLAAMGLSGFFLAVRGIGYFWTVPLFEIELILAIGNLAAMIFAAQVFIIMYLIFNWDKAVPPEGVKVIRDRGKAKRIKRGLVLSPLAPTLIGSDGTTELTEEDSHRILDVRKVVSVEGMAILCSNCNGATPLTKVKDNRLQCDYCGVTLGISNVFVPCENHPEFLAATTCAVCGNHFCRKCLTAQEPPIDERWKGSTIFVCRTCFEGRYRPAVTTTSFVIPIDQLFSTAGARFSSVSKIYRRFLGAYGGAMKHLWRLPLQLIASFGKGSRGSNDNCVGALIMMIIIIIAIPLIAGLLLLVGAIIIIPLLFYAGLVVVTIEAIKVISRTDFQSIDSVRIQSVIKKKTPKVKESTLRPVTRSWEQDFKSRSRAVQRKREIERRERMSRRDRDQSFFGGGARY
jgi:hypothetical protein